MTVKLSQNNIFLCGWCSLPKANGALWDWFLGVQGVEADGFTGVGGWSATVFWGSAAASGGVTSRVGQAGVLTADFG